MFISTIISRPYENWQLSEHAVMLLSWYSIIQPWLNSGRR